MNCPKCKSDNTQRFKVIYEHGTSYDEHYSSSFHSGTVFTSGGSGSYFGTTNTSGTTTSQTILAKRFSPPERKSSLLALLCIFISAGLFVGFFLYHRDVSGFDFDFRLNIMGWTGISFMTFILLYYSIYLFVKITLEDRANPGNSVSYKKQVILLVAFIVLMGVKRLLTYYAALEAVDTILWIVYSLILAIPGLIYLYRILRNKSNFRQDEPQPILFLFAGSMTFFSLSAISLEQDMIYREESWAVFFSFLMFFLLLLGISQIRTVDNYNKNVFPGLYER